MKNLTITDILIYIAGKPHTTYFQVPDDIFNHAGKHVEWYAASSVLKHYNNYWAKCGETTTFDIWGEEILPIWIPSAQEYQDKNVIKISMTNNVLAEYAVNMNTIND